MPILIFLFVIALFLGVCVFKVIWYALKLFFLLFCLIWSVYAGLMDRSRTPPADDRSQR